MDNMNFLEGLDDTDPTDGDISALLDRLQGSFRPQHPPEPRHEHTASRSSWEALPTVTGTGDHIRSVVENLTTAINNMIQTVTPEEFLDARRETVVHLTGYVQESAARTVAALLLLNYYLPQPDQRLRTDSVHRFGVQAIQCIHEALMSAFVSNVSSSLPTTPFSQETVIPYMHAMGPLVVEVLGFMEQDAQCNDDCDADEDDEEETRTRNDTVISPGDGGTGGDYHDEVCGTEEAPLHRAPSGSRSTEVQDGGAMQGKGKGQQDVTTRPDQGYIKGKKGSGVDKGTGSGQTRTKRKGIKTESLNDKTLGKDGSHNPPDPEGGLRRWLRTK